jgi:hypothetical protein
MGAHVVTACRASEDIAGSPLRCVFSVGYIYTRYHLLERRDRNAPAVPRDCPLPGKLRGTGGRQLLADERPSAHTRDRRARAGP